MRNMIENIVIHDPGSFIHSDNSPISFTIKASVKISKPSKRSVYNYKKANWDKLNNNLTRIDCEECFSHLDIHRAWHVFKEKLLSLCNQNIPKIRIFESFSPPWYDSDVFRLNKKKEHFRKLYKETKSTNHYSKFSALRKSLKALIKSKMRANFDEELSPRAISKKFWSYVKSSSKSNRIPEKMHLGSCFRNTSKDITDLFNK